MFRKKHGDENEREWEGLTRLADAGLRLAPTPLARSENAILMSWCPGTPIVGPSNELREALVAMYGIRLEPPVHVVRSAPSLILDRCSSISSFGDLPASAQTWLRSDEVESLRHVHLRQFVRGDGNLNNVLATERSVCILDFEDCGRGDWVLDIAEMTEHVRARVAPDRVWMDLFESFAPGPSDHERFASARRLYAVFWLALRLRSRSDFVGEQSQRVEALLG